jgi:dipeptidyl aminopeptidase/acylaminoacyl peptidase
MTKRLLSAEDLLELKFIGDPNVSPSKDAVAYVSTRIDIERNGYYSYIFLSDLEGNQAQLTNYYSGEKLVKDTAPKWSPDGNKIAFLSNRTGKNQVWVLSVKGGEAVQLTDVDGSVVDYSWSPAGDALALTVQEPKAETDSDVLEITRLRYKADGVREFLSTRKHVHVFTIETKEVEQITSGDFDFYGVKFSPDGERLAYLGSKEATQEIEYLPSIWQYDLSLGEESLLHQGSGPIRSLTFSPDGKWLGFIGHEHGETSSNNLDVWAVSLSTKEALNLSSKLDRTVDNPVRVDAHYETGEQKLVWNADSSRIYFTATDHGSIKLYQTDLEGNVSDALSEGMKTITSFDMIRDDLAVFVQAHCHSTGDLVVQDVKDITNQKKLTKWNDELFSELSLSTPEHLTFTGKDGLNYEGWLLHPPAREEGQKSPFVLQIHGGPHSAYGYGFQHEWQLMAAKGYAVLYINPRGSQGYGEDFLQRVVGDWGGEDYHDQMNAVDHVLEKYDYIDREQLFVTGASYGGYMTNMITARTNRFKAAATQNCVTNLYSMFGTSDIGFYFNSSQLGGADMWEDEETVMKFSPIRYAKNVKTPTLILHNEIDYRCPMEQAEQWYIALRRLGVETKLIRFPDENHGIASKGKPKHRLERLHHLIGWFERYRG